MTSDPGTTSDISAGQRYLHAVAGLIERLERLEWPNIEAAADVIAEAMADGRVLHAFGSGHSHMLAEELFYRAGGFVRVRPILFEGLMLHASAPLSTTLERVSGLATAILSMITPLTRRCAAHRVQLGQQRGRHRDGSAARSRGVRTIAITSVEHATSDSARERPGGRGSTQLVDVAIDNGGVVGDAAIAVEGTAQAGSRPRPPWSARRSSTRWWRR